MQNRCCVRERYLIGARLLYGDQRSDRPGDRPVDRRWTLLTVLKAQGSDSLSASGPSRNSISLWGRFCRLLRNCSKTICARPIDRLDSNLGRVKLLAVAPTKHARFSMTFRRYGNKRYEKKNVSDALGCDGLGCSCSRQHYHVTPLVSGN